MPNYNLLTRFKPEILRPDPKFETIYLTQSSKRDNIFKLCLHARRRKLFNINILTCSKAEI